MKYIPLGGKYGVGKHAIVDDADYETLSAHKWYVMKNGYAARTKSIGRKDGKKLTTVIFLHRETMRAREQHVHHINHDKLDNRKVNLQLVTQQQNNYSVGMRKDNKTGYKGVFFRKDRIKRPYMVRVVADKINYNLGHFSSPEEAAQAYNTKAKELFGEFALLNDIQLGPTTPETRTAA